MSETVKPSAVAHPRATWIDPVSGKILSFKPLMQEMASKSVVMLGEHTISPKSIAGNYM